MSRPRVTWTEEMTAALREMRAAGIPLYRCAESIGISYPTAVLKARELGLAERLNFGRKTGEQLRKEKS